MKCLSIRQPWAWLIVAGWKRIENRGWKTRCRGRLALHAAARLGGSWDDVLLPHGIALPSLQELPRGALVGTVELVDCLRIEELPPERRDDPHAVGPWCWLLADPRPLAQPIPCKGRLGLWDVPALRAVDLVT